MKRIQLTGILHVTPKILYSFWKMIPPNRVLAQKIINWQMKYAFFYVKSMKDMKKGHLHVLHELVWLKKIMND